MHSIRPFQPIAAEYAATVAIYNALWPDERPLTVAMCQENYAEWPSTAFRHHLVLEEDGAIIANGSCYEAWWQHQPGLIHLDFFAHPDHSGRRLDHAIYQALLAVVQRERPQTSILGTATREDQQERVDFLVEQGFQAAMRSPQSALTVADFDATRFQGVAEQVASQGLRLYTLSELMAQEPNWKELLRALRWAIVQDVPAVEPPSEPSMADFERMVLTDPALDPEAWFVAVDPTQGSGMGLWVGQSNLWVNDKTYQRLDTGLTGTVRAYRRRGLAMALKLRTVDYAQRKGAQTIATSNEENNPMYQINLRLGFQPKPAWVSYRKQQV